jgi:RNA polymerase primary sigma factor
VLKIRSNFTFAEKLKSKLDPISNIQKFQMRELVISTAILRQDGDSLHRYFHDIEKISLVNVSEEEQLCKRITEGDQRAISALILANLRFVITVAKRYQTKGISLSDLISEGNLGLIRAAHRFDHTKGFRFISYAVWWIRQGIISAIDQQTRFIHLPLNQVVLLGKYQKALVKVEQHVGRAPTMEEIAAELGIEKIYLTELLSQVQAMSSLDHPLGSDSSGTLYDIIPQQSERPDEPLIRESVQTEITDALKILPEMHREIITLYFGLRDSSPIRLEDIAKLHGLSVEHTRRLKDKALEKLRYSSKASKLKACL